MKIGLTYDLREDYLNAGFSLEETAELDKPETIDSIAAAIRSAGHTAEKIGGLQPLMSKLLKGKRWDLVFNIAEGLYGLARESTIPCLLDAYKIPYVFSDSVTLATCLHKGFTKRIIHELNIPTAPFGVISNINELDLVLQKNKRLVFPLFIKPVAEGTGKGINAKSIIHDIGTLKKTCTRLIRTFKQPVLIETYLPGREFTVGMIGTGENARVLGAMEIHFNAQAKNNIYSFDNKATYEDKIEYTLLKEKSLLKKIEAVCLASWRGLNCRDAGRIDIRCDQKGQPNFIEVNPLAGLHPVDSDLIILCRMLDVPHERLIQMILASAIKRTEKDGGLRKKTS